LETRLTIAFIVYERIKFLPRKSSIFMIETKIGCCVLKSLLRVSNAANNGKDNFLWSGFSYTFMIFKYDESFSFKAQEISAFPFQFWKLKLGKFLLRKHSRHRISNRLAVFVDFKEHFLLLHSIFPSFHDSKVSHKIHHSPHLFPIVRLSPYFLTIKTLALVDE
jgi:hypothetical protein